MLAHVATINQVLTLYSPELEFRRSARLPFWLMPIRAIGADSVLVATQLMPFVYNRSRIVWFSISQDSIVEDRILQFDAGLVGKDTVVLSSPQITPGGEIVLKAGQDHLAWFSRDGTFLAVAEVPDFGLVYPSEREVEEWGDGRTRLAALAHQPPPTKKIEEFRRRPLGRTVRVVGLQVDRSNGVWVATTRPSQVGTYLAAFQHARYLGEIEIPGRVLEFQIADSLLVALVEALEPDGDGLYPRRLDWYRIVEK